MEQWRPAVRAARALMLATACCTLQPPTVADLEAIARLYSEPRVRTYLGGAISDGDAIVAARRLIEGRGHDHVWVVQRRKDDRGFCGVVMLGPHCDGLGTEISYLFDPVVWGTGIAGQSVSLVLSHAHDRLALVPIFAETQRDNTPSRRLLARCGMREIARLHRFGAEQVLYCTNAGHSLTQQTAD